MQVTRAIYVAWLAVAGLGAGCSGKKSEPSPSKEAPRAPVAQATTPVDAAVPVDAAAATLGSVEPGSNNPVESRFRRRYTPDYSLSGRMERRIRYHLRSQTKAPIALTQIIRVPQASGAFDVFAIYEYSVFENCMLGYEDRKEGRENCLPAETTISDFDPMGVIQTDDKKVRLNESCVVRGAVRVHFDPPGPGIPEDAGGKLTIHAAKLEDSLCVVHGYDHLFVADLDGDEKLEMYIDITTTEEKLTTEPGMRDRPERTIVGDHSQRHLYVFDGDKTEGFALSAMLADSENGYGTSRDQELVELRDVNKDHRLDMIVKEHCLGNPVFDKKGTELCGGGPREKTVYFYSPQEDAWSRTEDVKEPASGDSKGSASGDSKEPAAGAAKEPAKAPATGASAPP